MPTIQRTGHQRLNFTPQMLGALGYVKVRELASSASTYSTCSRCLLLAKIRYLNTVIFLPTDQWWWTEPLDKAESHLADAVPRGSSW